LGELGIDGGKILNYNVKIILGELQCEGLGWIYLAQGKCNGGVLRTR
jgi:hypothetical protein